MIAKLNAAKLCTAINAAAYELPINHGHTLELISHALGYRDWNTVSAMVPEADKIEIKRFAKLLRTAVNSRDPAAIAKLTEGEGAKS